MLPDLVPGTPVPGTPVPGTGVPGTLRGELWEYWL
jgi:hypothetical protein